MSENKNAPESFKEWYSHNWIDEEDGYKIKDVQQKAYEAGQESCKKYKIVIIDGCEYILKSTADKENYEAVDKAENIAIEQSFKQLEEILKPIRDELKSYDNLRLIDMNYQELFYEFLSAIKETLEIADKAGKC